MPLNEIVALFERANGRASGRSATTAALTIGLTLLTNAAAAKAGVLDRPLLALLRVSASAVTPLANFDAGSAAIDLGGLSGIVTGGRFALEQVAGLVRNLDEGFCRWQDFWTLVWRPTLYLR